MFTFRIPRAIEKHATLKKIAGVLARYWVIPIVIISILLLLQAIFVLNETAKGEFRNSQYFTFVDNTGDLPFQSILDLPDNVWSVSQDMSLKSSAGKLWVKVDVSALNQKSILLHFKDPLLDNVLVKVVDDNYESLQVLAEYEVGDLKPFAERALALPYFVIPIELTQSSTSLYISASSKLSTNLAFGLWSNQGFIEFYDNLTTFLGIVFGYIMALICYSVMMFAKTRRAEYLWYALYLGAFFFHVMTLSGFAYQYLWPFAVDLQMIMGGASIGITYVCLIKFTHIMLGPINKRFNFLFNVQVYTHLILSLFSIYTLNTVFLKFHLIAVLLSSFLVPITCLITRKESSNTSLFFALVWFVFLLTSIASIFVRTGLVTLNIDPLHTLLFGFHIQTLLIGSALVFGYRESVIRTLQLKKTALSEKEKTAKAKDEILKLQQDAQYKLERQVKAQTMQLEGALTELSSTSAELKLLRNQDGLTGLPNRLAFDDALQNLSKESIRSQKALCITVIDIDYFKTVNDSYGHIAGDECLRRFSVCLRDTFDRKDFAYCRYGGEEFVLATGLPLKDVERQVNRFRLVIESLRIESSKHTISFTISAGIASRQLTHHADSKTIFAEADEKLYLAKQKGRNLVIA
jgi:diguanylate cyclase (GGDEF)-like protein